MQFHFKPLILKKIEYVFKNFKLQEKFKKNISGLNSRLSIDGYKLPLQPYLEVKFGPFLEDIK